MPAIVMAPICLGFDYRWSDLISYGYVRDDLLGVTSNEQCHVLWARVNIKSGQCNIFINKTSKSIYAGPVQVQLIPSRLL